MTTNRTSIGRIPELLVAVVLFVLTAIMLAPGVAGAQSVAANAPAADASLSPTTGSVDTNPDYRLGSGDRVRINVFNQRDLTDVYQIDGMGRIEFPLVGQIQAGGLTPKQLEAKVAHVLSPDYVKNPHVSVVVLTYRPFYIMGEVTKPGPYPYVSGMTVLTAAAQAGGFTYRANEHSFDLQRGESGKKTKMDAKPDTPIQPGDVITVNERIF